MPPLQTKFETLHANLQVLNKGQEYMPKEYTNYFPTESHTKVLLLFFPDQNFCFLYMDTWTVLSFKQTINRMELANFWSVLRDLDENLTCFDTIHSKPLLVIDCKRRRKVQRVSLEWARMRLNQDRDRERERNRQLWRCQGYETNWRGWWDFARWTVASGFVLLDSRLEENMKAERACLQESQEGSTKSKNWESVIVRD